MSKEEILNVLADAQAQKAARVTQMKREGCSFKGFIVSGRSTHRGYVVLEELRIFNGYSPKETAEYILKNWKNVDSLEITAEPYFPHHSGR